MAKVLRGGDSVLAGLDERALTAMFAVSVNNDRLMRRIDPGLFAGDLALFVATVDRGENPAGSGRPNGSAMSPGHCTSTGSPAGTTN